MEVIHKYQIPIEDEFIIGMERGAKILCFQKQRQNYCIWAIVNPRLPLESRSFRIVGTGIPYEKIEGKYIGTVQNLDDTLVWHLFEINKRRRHA